MKSRKEVAQTIQRTLNFTVEPPLRDQLLTHALQEQEQSWNTQPVLSEPTTRRMIMKIATPRIVLAALVGAGVVAAAAVGVSVQKYHFLERRPEQGFLVQSEDGHNVMNITESHAATPEQAVATAEEIALLRQQGQRELVGVTELEANGQLDGRVLSYKYTLSDGRTITMGEGDPESHSPWTLMGERHAEASRLLREMISGGQCVMTENGPHRLTSDGKEIPTFERVVQGRTFTFNQYTFTLSDGTEVVWSLGRLKDNQ
jgi:hypothetical protein